MPILGIIASSVLGIIQSFKTIFFATSDGKLKKSTNSGASFSDVVTSANPLNSISYTTITASNSFNSELFGGTVSEGSVYLLGGNNNTLLASTNSTTWTTIDAGFGSSNIMAVEYFGDDNEGYLGQFWNVRAVPRNSSGNFDNAMLGIAYGNGLFVSAGQASSYISTDAITWTSNSLNVGNNSMLTISYGNNNWVAGGYLGLIRTSTNGSTWITATSNIGSTAIRSITYGNSLWVAGADLGIMRTSTDTITWTAITSNFGNTRINSVAYGNGLWVAGGNSGQIRRSTDGITWTTGTSSFGETVLLVVYGNNQFVQFSQSFTDMGGAFVGTSTDGITWVSQNKIPSSYIFWPYSGIWADNTWILAGAEAQENSTNKGNTNAIVKTSTDLVTWNVPTAGGSSQLRVNALAYGNDILLFGRPHSGSNDSSNALLVSQKNKIDKTFIASSTGNLTKTSTNLTSWTTLNINKEPDINFANNLAENSIKGFAINNAYKAIIGDNGLILRSSRSFNEPNDYSMPYNRSGFTWITRTASFGNSTIMSIAYSNSIWVAGGYAGRVSTSTDTITWTSRTSNFGNSAVRSIAYGHNLWVAVGIGSQIRTSTDAVTWTTETSNFSTDILSVAYGNNLLVAGGANGQLRTSTDAIAWTTETSNISSIRSIAYGNDLWVAGGDSGQLRTSTDAVTWTTQTSNFGNTRINSVAYGNSLWVAGGYTGQLRTSTDAVTWTTRTMSLGNSNIISIAYGNSLFVAGGVSGGFLRTSTDGFVWTARTSNITTGIRSAGYGNDQWVIGGDSAAMRTSSPSDILNVKSIGNVSDRIAVIGTDNQYYDTIDPNGFSGRNLLWQHRSPRFWSTSFDILSATYGNSIWVGICNGFATNGGAVNGMSISTDGLNWNQAGPFNTPSFGSTHARVIAYGNGLFVVAGFAGNLATSTGLASANFGQGGNSFTVRTSNFGNTIINSVAYGNSLWVAAGNTGQLRTSTDGITWTTETSNFGNTNIRSVAYGNSLWVAGGYTGQLRTSTDGITWTTETSNFGNIQIRSVAYGNDLWVAGGDTGQLRTSTDGITWTTETSNFGNSALVSIAYNNDLWVAGGANGQLRTSTDAVTWTTRPSPFGSNINALVYNNNIWAAFGNNIIASIDHSVLTSPQLTSYPTFSLVKDNLIVSNNQYIFTLNREPLSPLYTGADYTSSAYFTGISGGFKDISKTDDGYVLVGDGITNNNSYFSTDLITWTTLTNAPSADNINDSKVV